MPISHASPTSNGRILCVPNQNLTPRSQRSQRFLNPFIPQFPFASFARESASRNCGALAIQSLTPRTLRSARLIENHTLSDYAVCDFRLSNFKIPFPSLPRPGRGLASFARESASRNCGAWENPNCPTYRVTLILMNSLPDPVACACFFTKPSGEDPVPRLIG